MNKKRTLFIALLVALQLCTACGSDADYAELLSVVQAITA